ncbi:Proteasome assembly chaperones 2 (PAC2) [Corynebacterium kutscheri]|uniref:ATP-grasp superfamily enzyme n=1 Tax=Corynebacterium kutscheri TaxID=35755 RepID=A0A0F6R242_9CORY|nr:PAC2 family protein [Corynebacterium kutscheri]AKE41383.1 ATP-grasp superfamily enzyme [Corynebacterium kutscheri]VEH09707.1 Proteasome assembly chaperones 2 (PAC2) [Corynebacterium kutscheri]VEH79789.1 Proteasome assembly chaperones 2 (PAC2) [Corynebacterium kutscheri]
MQEENRRMYELVFPAPEVKTPNSDGPTLIVALEGYADAGQAIDASSEHLLAALDHLPVASFNSDELIDYRSRRPAVTIDYNTVVDVEDLNLGINVLKDNKGTPFLLLSGPEPDMRWESFTHAVADLVDKFGVNQTICLYSAPMAVPHSRPLIISAHGNTPELIDSQFSLDTKITVPGSATLLLERLLHQRGKKVAGFTAHVPHYLSASPYPSATLGLLEAISKAAHLTIPLHSLEEDAARIAVQIEEQIQGSPEIEQVVSMLETQYDEELERYRQNNPTAVLPGEGSMPSGEQLGAEFENFLATLDDRSIEGNSSSHEDPSED